MHNIHLKRLLMMNIIISITILIFMTNLTKISKAFATKRNVRIGRDWGFSSFFTLLASLLESWRHTAIYFLSLSKCVLNFLSHLYRCHHDVNFFSRMIWFFPMRWRIVIQYSDRRLSYSSSRWASFLFDVKVVSREQFALFFIWRYTNSHWGCIL